MKWYKTAETNYLAHEVIAFFMREENYDKYKNAKFTTKYVDGNYIVILYNENEDIETLFPKDEVKETYNLKGELDYIKMIAFNLMEQLGGFLKIFLLLNPLSIKTIGDFNQRGGINIVLNENKYIEITLNFSDLYDIKYFENGKLINEYNDIYFDGLQEILYK
ncbi:hypothetical protein [Fusobacterium varium]|uniref:hypothetical protein n=1 Tax=Fusobacterium varium TaxID=856 RepID=UPI001F1A7A97|nr:hypothetical protein [Fusobacterium varium]MCF2673612.1 hypothetical protein [Fusobacterium varium]